MSAISASVGSASSSLVNSSGSQSGSQGVYGGITSRILSGITGGIMPQSQAQQAASNAASGTVDSNNATATGFNANTGSSMPVMGQAEPQASQLIGGVGAAPVATSGNFSPQTNNTAQGVFGSEEQRGIAPYKKPLINF